MKDSYVVNFMDLSQYLDFRLSTAGLREEDGLRFEDGGEGNVSCFS